MAIFEDRVDAGRQLAVRLEALRAADPVVLGLPRGGVPVAAEVARHLGAPLDVVLVRKLGVPWHPELAMGAVGEGGTTLVDEQVVGRLGLSRADVARVEERELRELQARGARLRPGVPPLDLVGRTAVVVDDGIATGATARIACRVARARGAARVVLAVPVGPVEAAQDVPEADEVVVLATPAHFVAVGQHYRDFAPTTDEQVADLLSEARGAGPGLEVDADVEVPVVGATLRGHLALPADACGVVLFAHGSGSGRHSPRNRFVAAALNRVGIGTLLLDLLSEAEEQQRPTVFDIPLLANRLLAATDWLLARPDASRLPLGYFGASTGAAAALVAAATTTHEVAAVVSRGGRPDLAGPHLARVPAPTLLVVGSLDHVVLQLNRRAQAMLRCPSRLVVVDGATHLFSEPGKLERVADLASRWFRHYFAASRGLPALRGAP